MSETEPDPKSEMEFDAEASPAGDRFKYILLVILAGIVLAIGYLFVTRGDREIRRGTVSQLERELDEDRLAMNAHAEKLIELSRRLESAKAAIQAGELKGGKIVAEYNDLAKQQRQMREELVKMREDYNAKVFKLQAEKGE